MVRRKINIKRIENDTARQVTFSKRKAGLIKKAHDLSVLCDAEVGVIVFSSKGKLFKFASTSMQRLLDRVEKACGDHASIANNSSADETLETDWLTQYTEKLKALQRNLIGENLERLCLRELVVLEQQIHESLGHIRARKEELLLDELEELKQKVADTRRTSTVNANILDRLMDYCSCDEAGCPNPGNQMDCQHCAMSEGDELLAMG